MSLNAQIVVLDDDDAVRDSLKVLLEAEDYTTETFSDAKSFLAAEHEEAQCILLDVRLPDGDGIDILQQLVDRGVAACTIIMTGHGDVPMAVKAMRIGASDFVEKPFDPDEMLQAIERAISQFQASSKSKDSQAVARERLSRLTPRETEVMQQLVLGRPNKIIAYELKLSPRTVEVHRARVMEKTEAKSLSGLVRLAIVAELD